MKHRLEVLITPELDKRLRKAALCSGISKGEWVRRALEQSLREARAGRAASDPLARLSRIGAPTADIDQMLSEIEAGRS